MAETQEAAGWYSVTVFGDRDSEQCFETAFGILDASGTEVDTLGKMNESTIRYVAYFEYKPAESAILSALETAFEIHDIEQRLCEVRIEKVVEQDWLAEWKKHWKPTVAGKFLVAPPWEEDIDPNFIPIIIEPAMAFGTGTHETTRLCLELISKYYDPNMTFLDVGTGTGILSIAVAKLARDRVPMLAFDTDEPSVRAAAENAILNNVGHIDFKVGSISDSTPVFDLVCANMTIDIIVPMLALLIEKAHRVLILSGVLAEQEPAIKNELLKHDVQDYEVLRDGEWIALMIRF